MIKSDNWIRWQCERGMIDPYEPELIRLSDDIKRISYGQSSYGYDLRLSDVDFRIFKPFSGKISDPKRFNEDLLVKLNINEDETGKYFVMPANSYALGVTHERIRMEDNVTAICQTKSTYARLGLIIPVTPIEAGWQGYITLELYNASPVPCKVYALEGIVQLIFFEGSNCNVTYRDRKGKYDNQLREVTIARI